MTGASCACAQGVKAAVIGIRLSGGAGGAGGRIASGLRGAGVAMILARRESVGRLGWRERGERAIEIADAIQNDAAVEIGGCEARIILNRQIV